MELRTTNKIINLLKENGPLTGKELLDSSRIDPLKLWQICNTSTEISVNITGIRYLRIDRRIDGYARLSPSILREFLTYTVVGLKDDLIKIGSRAKAITEYIKKISSNKLELSKEVFPRLVMELENHAEIEKKAVFIIAGDVVYNMAHDELRPEPSTGEIIRGSDLDIIIVTRDLREDVIKKLDRSIYEQKYYLMKRPAYREEIDYIIKDLHKVEEQLHFNSFEFMVASKILDEGVFIFGSLDLFENIKKLLRRYRIAEKLQKMEETAITERKNARSYLLNADSKNLTREEYLNLFYTKEETEEIF